MNTQKLPLISVIIPIYNAEKYLKKCITSIIDQTYSELEIILINDGSTDDSLNICELYKSKDQRIVLLNISNAGVSNARNQGINIAKGDFIQFIDSDDFVNVDYIETLHSTLIKSKAELVVCGIESFDYHGTKIDEWSTPSSVLHFNNMNKPLFLELIDKFLLFGPVNKLYIKRIIINHSIRFDNTLSYGEDLLFNFEYFNYIKTIAITDQTAYKYIHDNTESLSKKKYVDKLHIVKRIHFVLLNFFKKINLTDKASLGVVYRRIFDYYYNEIFEIVNNKKLSLLKKNRKIKLILSDEELAKSYEYVAREKYASWIVFLMQQKATFTFLIVNLILSRIQIANIKFKNNE